MSSSSLTTLAMVAVAVLVIASAWRVFTKAGEAGWKSLVPIYGALVYLRIVGRPWWWLVLFCIPVVNLVPAIVTCFDLARVFGKSVSFGLGLLFLGPVFLMLLAFGDARYLGPSRMTVPVIQRAA
ncbi:MAG: hypothetical protein A2W00_01475 [Candidatus Eisenbacteria bacterium RBG_16_71_46]|nr:MAG: hypothetical protein A2W00_01475 [Candidatus Eisenbacteria bacterium RBG_16_71_46]OGF24403.1 MAG: hypothetical protein A2V63_08095 [Candidatus Eisenbacteria bacterium RBG_19FT_COMBO_70_11]